ncbi:unnamed protein product [Ostreobium quekettii]|uniref:Uncharacterized protein n=1 Tax=Ostreobium quekettii TaxID=121088 RepID=A0A8S1JCD1_9CHLO|nr:unnamed protein product [Ostreobium quekettii]
MAGLEHQVHLLSAQVQRLAVEKSSLQNQNDLLSKVLAMKEGQMNVLRHEAKTKDDDSPSGEVGPCPPCSMRAVLGLATVESASTYTAEVVMKMSLDEVCQKYKEYVHNLSELLISVDKPGGNPDAEGEIHKIMAYQGELLAKLVVLKPEHGAMFVGRNFELGRTELPDETEALKSTEGLLRGLELTSSQRKRIVALYHQFQTNMQRIRKNRQHLNKSLQDHLSVAEGEYVPGIGMHKVAKTTVEMDEVMQELKNTVDLERHEYSNLCGAFFAMILSSLQAARTIVRSYPFYPDVMGLTILVVRTSKEEDLDSGSDCTGASS